MCVVRGKIATHPERNEPDSLSGDTAGMHAAERSVRNRKCILSCGDAG
ncbi:hypothetical protein RRSWK_00543 [Rhodopirellula sp. SWK7]|nr:hypothetical protein RRSWK_00543 [Rhodopirellula sp. SWK7]